jgi:hypothetical protein
VSGGYWCSDVYPKSDPGCGRHFRSLRAFDAHFIRDQDGWPHCREDSALLGKGWVDDGSFWLAPDEVGTARKGAHLHQEPRRADG